MNRLSHSTLSGEGYQIGSVIKGLIWALLVTIILGIFISLLLQYTSLSEALLQSYSTFIFFISMLAGSTIGAKSAGCKGLLHGLSVALFYCLMTVIIGLVWNPMALSLLFLLKRAGFTLAAGMLGGIIGIGLSSK